jgi:histidinol-phosphatase (PHP family)
MIDYHIHTQHSIDASGTITAYCERAIELGLEEICITNHCELDPMRNDSFIRFNGEREQFSKSALLKLRQEILDAADSYKKRGLTVKFGIEVGYYKGIEHTLKEILSGVDLDFIIGAIHCLEHICIDSSKECTTYFRQHGVHQLVENYYRAVEDLIQCSMFDSLAHIDVYKKYGRDHYGNEIYDYSPDLMNRVFEMIRDNHIALEINTAGMRFMNEFYPAPALMKIARQQGVGMITIGSDSHRPEDLGKDLAMAVQYLKSYGFDSVYSFSKRVPSRRKI